MEKVVPFQLAAFCIPLSRLFWANFNMSVLMLILQYIAVALIQFLDSKTSFDCEIFATMTYFFMRSLVKNVVTLLSTMKSENQKCSLEKASGGHLVQHGLLWALDQGSALTLVQLSL